MVSDIGCWMEDFTACLCTQWSAEIGEWTDDMVTAYCVEKHLEVLTIATLNFI